MPWIWDSSHSSVHNAESPRVSFTSAWNGTVYTLALNDATGAVTSVGSNAGYATQALADAAMEKIAEALGTLDFS